MRRACRVFVVTCLAGPGLSLAEPVAEPPHEIPYGYAVDRPPLLADQLLWGIAHGIRLLGRACAREGHRDAAEAWLAWQEREAGEIARSQASLSRHYFRRNDAPPPAIAAAIGLKAELDAAPATLEPACATLAEALRQPRYDLARRRAEILSP